MRKTLPVCALALMLAACGGASADEHMAKGDRYIEESLLSEAIVEYRAAAQADGMRGDVRLKLAEAYTRQGDIRSALPEYLRAADMLPNDAKAQIKAGQMLLLARQFVDAQSRAKKALAIQPSDSEPVVLLGNALAGLNQLDDAVSQYQEALALNPGEESAYANIGTIQLARGQRVEAEATFRKAVEAAPKSVSAKLGLASFFWATERQKEAEDLFKETLALDPGNLRANRALGVFYMATGRASEAEQFFKKIAETARTPDATLGLVDYYVSTRRFDEAKSVLTELAAKPESFASATIRIAAIEAAQNNKARAYTLVDQVLAKQPRFVPARVLNLRLLLTDLKNEEAMNAAVAITRDEPNTPAAVDAFVAIGALEAARDRTDEAVQAFGQALRIDQRSMAATLGLARTHLAAGAVDRAETHVKHALTLQPGNPAPRALMVRIQLARGDVAKATQELAILEKAYPNSPSVLNLSGARHLTAGRYDAARAAFMRVADSLPSDLESLEGLIAVDLAQGRRKEAVERIDGALKRIKPSAGIHVLAARTYAAAGDQARAEESLKKAIEVEPHRLTAYTLLGSLYMQQKRLPDAKEQFAALAARNPRSVSANTMLGMITEAQGDKAAAEAAYQKTLGIDPEAAVAANNLAWLFVSSGRNLAQAQQLAKTALKHLPDSPQVNDTLGWIYYQSGSYQKAVTHLEQSLKRDASDPVVHYHLGMTYLRLAEFAKAKQALAKALSMNANFDGAADAKGALAGIKY